MNTLRPVDTVSGEQFQDLIINHSLEHGDGNSNVSKEEIIEAITPYVGEEIARQMAQTIFAATKEAGSSALTPNGKEINFGNMTHIEAKNVSDIMKDSGLKLSNASKADNQYSNDSTFDKMDANDDGQVNKKEHADFVKNHVPGGDRLSMDEINAIFSIIAKSTIPDEDNPSEETANPNIISKEQHSKGLIIDPESKTSHLASNIFGQYIANKEVPEKTSEIQELIEIIKNLFEEFSNSNQFDGYA